VVKVVKPTAQDGSEFGYYLLELYTSVSFGYTAYFFFKAVNALLCCA
jgi:hypothetical protein